MTSTFIAGNIIHAYTLLSQNDNPRPAFLAAIHFHEGSRLETAANTCPGTSSVIGIYRLLEWESRIMSVTYSGRYLVLYTPYSVESVLGIKTPWDFTLLSKCTACHRWSVIRDHLKPLLKHIHTHGLDVRPRRSQNNTSPRSIIFKIYMKTLDIPSIGLLPVFHFRKGNLDAWSVWQSSKSRTRLSHWRLVARYFLCLSSIFSGVHLQ